MAKRHVLLWVIALTVIFTGCGTPREKSDEKMNSAAKSIGQAQELQRQLDEGVGNATELQGQIDKLKVKALQLSKESIEDDSTNINAYYNYGIIMQSFGQFSKAIEQYQRGLSKLPAPPYEPALKDSLQNLYNSFNLGMIVCYKNQKDYVSAVKYSAKVQQYFPSRYAEALFNYGFFLQASMNESKDPVKNIDSAIVVFKESIRWYQEAAQRGSADASKIYDAAYYVDQAYRAKAKATNSKPNFAGITDAYQRAANADPNNAQIYVRLASAYDEAGQSAQALEVYRKAIEKNPTNKTVRNNYAMLLSDKGKSAEAAQELKALIQNSPDYAMAYFNLASVLQKSGKGLSNSEVRGYLQKYVELAKSDPAQAQNVAQVEQLLK
jgi:tetratricopeptide (TPR) repeat protein